MDGVSPLASTKNWKASGLSYFGALKFSQKVYLCMTSVNREKSEEVNCEVAGVGAVDCSHRKFLETMNSECCRTP